MAPTRNPIVYIITWACRHFPRHPHPPECFFQLTVDGPWERGGAVPQHAPSTEGQHLLAIDASGNYINRGLNN